MGQETTIAYADIATDTYIEDYGTDTTETTDAAGYAADATTINCAGIIGSSFAAYDTVRIAGLNEWMFVTSVTTAQFTVIRGFAGTTAEVIPTANKSIYKAVNKSGIGNLYASGGDFTQGGSSVN